MRTDGVPSECGPYLYTDDFVLLVLLLFLVVPLARSLLFELLLGRARTARHASHDDRKETRDNAVRGRLAE